MQCIVEGIHDWDGEIPEADPTRMAAELAFLGSASAFLEKAERDFQQLVGIPFVASSCFNQKSCFAAQRGRFTVGRLAALLGPKTLEQASLRWVETPGVSRV